jgi:hypothetical protein
LELLFKEYQIFTNNQKSNVTKKIKNWFSDLSQYQKNNHSAYDKQESFIFTNNNSSKKIIKKLACKITNKLHFKNVVHSIKKNKALYSKLGVLLLCAL